MTNPGLEPRGGDVVPVEGKCSQHSNHLDGGAVQPLRLSAVVVDGVRGQRPMLGNGLNRRIDAYLSVSFLRSITAVVVPTRPAVVPY